MATVIHSQKLDKIKPLVWYGKPVYTKYEQIQNVLIEEFGSEIEDFLLKPDISQAALEGIEDAVWFSNKYSRLKPLNQFPAKTQDKLKIKLKHVLEKISLLVSRFEASESDNEKEFSEFLKLVVEIPTIECVYSNGKNIVLVCWGFKSIGIQDRDFRLSHALDNSNVGKKPFQDTQGVSTNLETKTNLNKYYVGLVVLLLIAVVIGLVYYFKNTPAGYKQNVGLVDPAKVAIDEKDPMKGHIVINRLIVVLNINNGSTNEGFKGLMKTRLADLHINIVSEDAEIGFLELEIAEGDRDKIIQRLEALREVISVQPVDIFSGSYLPNDNGFREKEKKWSFKATNTFKGWDIEQGNGSIVVAIIDGAFDLNHPELKDKEIVNPWNAATGQAFLTKGSPKGYEHGTHVAATAVGSIDNSSGTGGVCPRCSLMPIQLGQDNMEGFSASTVIRAMLYAIRNGADVINLSIGASLSIDASKLSPRDKMDLRNIVRRKTVKEEIVYERIFKLAKERNVVVVFAAGNSNMYSDIDPQKRSADILVVGAINKAIKKSVYSDFGENVMVSAPGDLIYNAIPDNKYTFKTGTSMAAPLVSGLVGLMKSRNPNLPNEKINEILVSTGKKINDNDGVDRIGVLVQVDKALAEASKAYSPEEEVIRLRKELKMCRSGNHEKMVIPKNSPVNFKFAEGLWKSNTELYNSKDNKIDKSNPIVLYFDINRSGKGLISLHLVNKKEECNADIELSIHDEVLNINQLNPANCNKSNHAYHPYKFHCSSIGNEAATCKAAGMNEFEFELIKVQ